MDDALETRAITDFVKRAIEHGIESTGATVVQYSGNLYNVVGSTTDPKHVPNHDGEAWKQLLIAYGINGSCYVTNPGAGGSHPAFSVGGHMTPNSNGLVPVGGTCYLMPLCYWHNSTSKDGIAFTHNLTSMLQLSGYMQGELAVTFQLRLPSSDPFSLLYRKEGHWNFQNLSTDQAEQFRTKRLPPHGSPEDDLFVLVERIQTDTIRHHVRESNLI